MQDLSWREAIAAVLQDSDAAMHYSEIAEAIAEKELRTEFGANPAATVAATISASMLNDRQSPFIKVERGRYWLRALADAPVAAAEEAAEIAIEEAGFINAFGMYWSRAKVNWTPGEPKIWGQLQLTSKHVDFCSQRGVYLLHDGRSVVYVGRTTDHLLGVRLRQHIYDRLNGRWDRFSWFGIHKVNENGALIEGQDRQYDINLLIATMEALLIEGLEPPQNRKRGDDFKAIEFLQVEDPELEKAAKKRMFAEIVQQL